MSAVLALVAAGLVPLADPGTWISSKDYPAEALRKDEAGPVTVSLTVNSGGKPVACEVEASSSSEALDAATCALLVERARFQPFDDAAQRTTQQRVVWTIPDRTRLAEGGVIADISLDGKGNILACTERVIGGSRLIPGDPCDLSTAALDNLFGAALRRAKSAHFRFVIVPRDQEAISIEAGPDTDDHKVFMELYTEVTPEGFPAACQAVHLDRLFRSENPCDWFSAEQPDFLPDPTRTTNRSMKVILDTWTDRD
jgi:TonB family protein